MTQSGNFMAKRVGVEPTLRRVLWDTLIRRNAGLVNSWALVAFRAHDEGLAKERDVSDCTGCAGGYSDARSRLALDRRLPYKHRSIRQRL